MLPQTARADGTLAFVPPAMTSPFYESCQEGALYAAGVLGYDLKQCIPDSEKNLDEQAQILEELVQQNVDGIALCSNDYDQLKDTLLKVQEADIPIVLFNTLTELDGVEISAYCGYDQYQGGQKIADWIYQETAGDAKVAIIEGLSSDFTTQRKYGFIDQADANYPEIEVVTTIQGDWLYEKSMEETLDMLQKFPEVNVIYALSDEMALGAVEACRQLDRETIICIGIDGNPTARAAVVSGDLGGTLDCGAFGIGVNAIKALHEAISGEGTSGKQFLSETTIIDESNVIEYLY